MNNTNFIESNKMYLDVITPINIASNEKLDVIDYLYDNKSKIAYFLNPLLWHKFIYHKGLFSAYMNFINDKAKSRKILYEWLSKHDYSIKDIEQTVKYKLTAHLDINKLDKKNLNNIILQTKLVDGRAYIPGSTIKGIIRTAILYDLLQKNPYLKEKYWQSLVDVMNKHTKSFEKRKVDRAFEKEIKSIENELEEILTAKIENTKDGKYSFMQGIKISDALPEFESNKLSLLQKIDIVIKNTGIKENELSVYRECIEPQMRFYFDIQLETAYKKFLNINSIDDILVMLKNFFEANNKLLISAFGRDYGFLFNNADLSNIYIGGGTGFLTKTLVAYIAPTDIEAKKFISKYLNMKFGKRKIIPDIKLAPRTLKATRYNNKLMLMGMAKIARV